MAKEGILDSVPAYVYLGVAALIGRIRYEREHGGLDWNVSAVRLLSIAEVTLRDPVGLPRWMLERRIRKIEKVFQKNGIRRMIVPDGFPYEERFSKWSRINLVPFYRSIADLLVLASLESDMIDPGKAIVSLSAPRIFPELRQAAERLCPIVRGMTIDVPGEGERYAGWLHKRYGLPVRGPGEENVTVAFGPACRTGGTVISLYEDKVSLAGLRIASPDLTLPEGYGDQMLAALWECGSLERGSLNIYSAEQRKY